MRKLISSILVLFLLASCSITVMLSEENFDKAKAKLSEYKELKSKLDESENQKLKLKEENKKLLEQKNEIEEGKEDNAILEENTTYKKTQLESQKSDLEDNKGYIVLNNKRFDSEYLDLDKASKGTIVVIEPDVFYSYDEYKSWHILKNYYVFDYDTEYLFSEILVKGSLPKRSDFKKTIYLKYLKKERPEVGMRHYLFFEFLGYKVPKSIQNKVNTLNKKQKEIDEIQKKIEKLQAEDEKYRGKLDENSIKLEKLQDNIYFTNNENLRIIEKIKEIKDSFRINYNIESEEIEDTCLYKNQEYSTYKECLISKKEK